MLYERLYSNQYVLTSRMHADERAARHKVAKHAAGLKVAEFLTPGRKLSLEYDERTDYEPTHLPTITNEVVTISLRLFSDQPFPELATG